MAPQEAVGCIGVSDIADQTTQDAAMKPLPTLAASFAIAAVSCAVAYRVIGTTVDRKGVLHEPFALIPIGYLLGGAAIATACAAVLRQGRGQKGSDG